MQPDRHLLIDGYNVIHALPQYTHYLPASLDLSCNLLVESARVIHDVDGWAVSVVFDGRGSTLEISKPGNQPGFSVVYSPLGVTADGVIEQIVRRSSDPTNLTVISRDNLVAESVRAAGGVCSPPEELEAWIARCQARQQRHLDQRRRKQHQREAADSPWNALDNL